MGKATMDKDVLFSLFAMFIMFNPTEEANGQVICPEHIDMCHIRLSLYNGCYHNERILTLCDKQQQKRLQKYREHQRRAQKSRGFFARLFSSSPPRPLLQPATTFSYTSFDIPKDVLRHSCRPSMISVQSTKYPDACPDCQSSFTSSKPATSSRPTTSNNRPTTSGSKPARLPSPPRTAGSFPGSSLPNGRPPTRRGVLPSAPAGRPVRPAPSPAPPRLPPQQRLPSQRWPQRQLQPAMTSSQSRRPAMHPRSRDSIVDTAIALPPSYPVGPTGSVCYPAPVRASVTPGAAARGSVDRYVSPLDQSRYERMVSSSTRRVNYRLDVRRQQPYQTPRADDHSLSKIRRHCNASDGYVAFFLLLRSTLNPDRQ
ncbi:hypothetical protein CMQ_3035 [Grosmannia clavigera kw1407]|uniref:Uncharacterized protein n=1 Tax=Grosmannia clavigera (strain kw1407 / UAMH 11150) TaxID=655863 RepID=F0XI69_GROCL|nr:uncharacterized protein CMQ_3035 [Grosmannia clavigera kw1407]EFX03106.1 hypothetical protein CMQ_3035 [Grosmannia clavigera kw1407]